MAIPQHPREPGSVQQVLRGSTAEIPVAARAPRAGDDPRPQVRKTRITGVDAARGFALIGMAAVHTYSLVTDDGDQSWSWALFAGKAAALFALLAGVSLAFMTGGSRRSTDGRTRVAACAGLAARALCITVIGLLVGSVVDAPYVILPYYGVMFLLAAPVLYSPARVLIFLAVVSALVAPFVMQAVRSGLPFPFVENPSLGDAFVHPWRLVTSLLLTGVYPAIPWMTYICAGLLIGRCDLRRARVAGWLLGGGTLLAVVPLLVSNVLLYQFGGYDALVATPGLSVEEVDDVIGWGPDPVLPSSTSWWLAISAAHSSTPVDLLHTTGVAMAVLGAVLLLERVRGARTLLAPLAALGTLTLTFYTLNVLATRYITSEDDTTFFASQVVVGLVVAVLWRHRFGQGPLERVVAAGAHRARDGVLRGGR
ncbi:heparan-alpha-glucosaminide N-acetyltransferase domain-containing protein [Kineococcus arenarius]|uniref:heparan-alpha-glucosaminide N-acetyltransferase domain-containing protein n=1 Tax=Kineococcus sp. SYSU DK007 TaxID=3383128 RepID=UPI003D7DA283